MELREDINERLFRAIRPIGFLWDNEFNRPSPAAFKDSNGLSVEKAGGRIVDDVLKTLSARHCADIIVKINVEQCLRISVFPINAPSRANKYHAEIHNSPTEKLIEITKRRKMAEICTAYFVKK